MPLSVCIIAKDEEKNLGKAIDSVKALADEIIVVDTGSSDKTKDIAKEGGAQVFDFKWTDDFSAARNESLKHATKDWILILDADETVGKSGLDSIKKFMENKEVMGYYLVQVNYSNNHRLSGWQKAPKKLAEKGIQGFTANGIVRLFQNNQGFQFSGRVHETVDASIKKASGKLVMTPVTISNYGNIDEEALERKRAFYLRLAQQNVKEKNDARSHFDLGVLYKETGDFNKAIKAHQDALKINDKFYLSHQELGVIYEKKEDYDTAIKHYTTVAEGKNGAVAYLGIGSCLIKQGKIDEAYESLKKALTRSPKNAMIHLKLGFIHEKKGDVKKALGSYMLAVKFNPTSAVAYMNLGNIFAKTGQLANAVRAYNEAIALGHPKKAAIEARIKEVKEKMSKSSAPAAS